MSLGAHMRPEPFCWAGDVAVQPGPAAELPLALWAQELCQLPGCTGYHSVEVKGTFWFENITPSLKR